MDGAFFWQSRPATPPPWVAFLDPVLTEVPECLRSSSASGLLLVKIADHHFALTFGYGRSLLDQAKVVRQFGLRVALNTIDHSRRSAASKPRRSKTWSSRGTRR